MIWMAVLFGLLAMDVVEPECPAVFTAVAQEALALDYHEFDQTPGSGFRVLAEAGCPRQAADLIETYIEVNRATENSLVWHLAQMRGEAGQIDEAISAAERARNPAPDPAEPFQWNAHVDAYLAILRQDRAAFDQALNLLLDHADAHPGNRMNGEMWQRLAPHFEAGYASALKLAYGQH